MKKLITTAAVTMMFLAACGKETGSAGQPAAEPNFKWLNANVFGPKCLECHGAGKKTPLTNYAQIARFVTNGDANNSKLYTLVKNHDMPKNRAPLAQTEVDAIGSWINGGALEASTLTTKK